MRVTFDMNVCNVHDPDKWPQLVAPEEARKIRAAISDRRISGFVSEATLFVECLSFRDKLTYLSVAGTQGPRPSPDPRMVAMFGDLASIGVELLRAPLIGSEKFVTSIPSAKDEVYSLAERQTRLLTRCRDRHRSSLTANRFWLTNLQCHRYPRSSVAHTLSRSQSSSIGLLRLNASGRAIRSPVRQSRKL
jgi:hypothetical protein